MAIKLDKDLLVVEQNKNCLLDATNFVKKSDKGKWVYSGYGMAFDGKVLGVLVMILWRCNDVNGLMIWPEML